MVFSVLLEVYQMLNVAAQVLKIQLCMQATLVIHVINCNKTLESSGCGKSQNQQTYRDSKIPIATYTRLLNIFTSVKVLVQFTAHASMDLNQMTLKHQNLNCNLVYQ